MFSVEEHLVHHGVLGMKWGVEREKAAAGNRGAQKKLAKADIDWEKELNSPKGYIKIHNAMADKMNNGGIAAFNKAHAKPGVDYSKPGPAQTAYYNAYEKVSDAAFKQSAVEIYGESPSGKMKVSVKTDANGPYLSIDTVDAGHADASPELCIRLNTDKNGQITGLGAIEQHSLAHFGILGMRWGYRNPDSQREEGESSGRTKSSTEDKKLVHPDHASAHDLAKNPTKQLSNADLQKVNQRLQLETQYSKLKSQTGSLSSIKKGNETVKTLLGVGTSVAGAYALGKSTMIFLKSPAGEKTLASGAKVVGKLIGRW